MSGLEHQLLFIIVREITGKHHNHATSTRGFLRSKQEATREERKNNKQSKSGPSSTDTAQLFTEQQ